MKAKECGRHSCKNATKKTGQRTNGSCKCLINKIEELSEKLHKSGWEAVNKRIAHAASLSLRFYKRDGWTKEELDQCCEKGQFEVSFEGRPDEYYLITPGSRYDELKIRSLISEIIKPFDRDETIENIIKSRNW